MAAFGGLVLLADGVRPGIGQRAWTPWQRLSAPRETPAAARPWRATAGVALVGLAAVLGLALLSAYAGGSGLAQVLLPLVVGGGALAVVAAPLLISALTRADGTRVRAAREDERLHVAAHLHDSVLQTLALVQRQAHDPAAVARLARRQESELRAWMAGEVEHGTDTLAGALRDAVAEVEDEHGATVEVTILGDRPLDRQGEALAAAAREALRNAARHAEGAPVFVFAQLDRDGPRRSCATRAPGSTRMPCRPSAAGSATRSWAGWPPPAAAPTVESVPGEGTEVALRIGARP